MHTPFFEVIDWAQPWLLPLRATARPILDAADWRQALDAAAAAAGLRNHRGLPIRFVAQSDLPPGTAYEAFISATGGVPTRDNLHDFLNALVWLNFPHTKARLNALQAAEISRSAATSGGESRHAARGKLRDAVTIFDENAALLVSRNAELVEALRGHRWREVFVSRRMEFERDCEVWLFGHALMEKLVAPYKAITAHARPVIAGEEFFAWSAQDKRAWIDRTVAEQLTNGLATSDLTPLPVLGVPGWWQHQDSDFYEDETVFRPKRTRP